MRDVRIRLMVGAVIANLTLGSVMAIILFGFTFVATGGRGLILVASLWPSLIVGGLLAGQATRLRGAGAVLFLVLASPVAWHLGLPAATFLVVAAIGPTSGQDLLRAAVIELMAAAFGALLVYLVSAPLSALGLRRRPSRDAGEA